MQMRKGKETSFDDSLKGAMLLARIRIQAWGLFSQQVTRHKPAVKESAE